MFLSSGRRPCELRSVEKSCINSRCHTSACGIGHGRRSRRLVFHEIMNCVAVARLAAPVCALSGTPGHFSQSHARHDGHSCACPQHGQADPCVSPRSRHVGRGACHVSDRPVGGSLHASASRSASLLWRPCRNRCMCASRHSSTSSRRRGHLRRGRSRSQRRLDWGSSAARAITRQSRQTRLPAGRRYAAAV